MENKVDFETMVRLAQMVGVVGPFIELNDGVQGNMPSGAVAHFRPTHSPMQAMLVAAVMGMDIEFNHDHVYLRGRSGEVEEKYAELNEPEHVIRMRAFVRAFLNIAKAELEYNDKRIRQNGN